MLPTCGAIEMGIQRGWKELSLALVEARDKIVEGWLQRLYRAAATLYEVLWDDAAPGAASQEYQGHDHTPNGGGSPIYRGVVWSENGGDLVLYQPSFGAANDEVPLTEDATATSSNLRQDASLMRVLESPGLVRGVGLLTGWICYEARNSTFTIQFGNGEAIELPATPNELPQWVAISTPLKFPGSWSAHDPRVRCGEYDPENEPALKIYAIHLEEEQAALAGLGGASLPVPIPAAAGGNVPSGHMELEEDLVAAEEWMDTDSLLRPLSMLNAVFEGTESSAAPGRTTRAVKPHDHDPDGYGGRAVGRGLVCMAANGNRGLWTSTPSVNTWTNADGGERDVDMMVGYVSPGLTSSGSPPSAIPYLGAQVYLYIDGAAASIVDLRMQTTATPTYSETTTIGAGTEKKGWFRINKIPCEGDAWNGFDLEIRTDTGGQTIKVLACLIVEESGSGAQGSSAGSNLAGGA